ncbi:RNA polymerase sigma24 factor [Opitutaceae bacterium TAV5]|nr:RNA polymerase sigma24 factor [Opitutaceae bacterium TAV5]
MVSLTVPDLFTEHRSLLFGLAYRMLGRVADAEDIVQETFLRWQQQDAALVRSPRAWLVATATRLCIDQMRSARRQREEYVGAWLPEPLVHAAGMTTATTPDQAAALADSLGMAFMLMLEELSPVERAVFLLREVFDHDYADIARIVDKSEAACRQIVSRTKTRLARREVTPSPAPSSSETEPLVRQFLEACATGNLEKLLTLLAPDAVLYTDGGGRVKSALRPIRSALYIGRFLVGIREHASVGAHHRPVLINGDPGTLTRRRDGILTASAFSIEGGRIRAIYMVSNPEKLHGVPAMLFPPPPASSENPLPA